MSTSTVTIRELLAWELDEYPYRSSAAALTKNEIDEKHDRARCIVSKRNDYKPSNAFLNLETARIQHLLDAHAQRAEVRREYEGLDWTLGVVDLRCLLAFQRRLVFESEPQPLPILQQEDWNALLSLSLGLARSIAYKMTVQEIDGLTSEFTLRSPNPDLQIRQLPNSELREFLPFSLYGGSPYFEVAELRGRWFLRDGYHRAYHLLKAGVHYLPAVVIYARTINELGATHPWFFNEEQLFSTHPPYVTDFLEESLVIQYQRPQLIKTISVRIEESLDEFHEAEQLQGDQQ